LRSPFDDAEITNDVHVAGKDDIEKACLAAENALKTGPWTQLTGAQRGAHLLRVAALIEENAEKLAYLESIPTGRPISGIIHFDIKHMVEVFRCKLLLSWYKTELSLTSYRIQITPDGQTR
jgi:aldehyde dehydrogenase (NAD+)